MNNAGQLYLDIDGMFSFLSIAATILTAVDGDADSAGRRSICLMECAIAREAKNEGTQL